MTFKIGFVLVHDDDLCSLPEAIRLFTRGCSHYEQGEMYEALSLWQLSSSLGHLGAMLNVGYFHLIGSSCDGDVSKAEDLWIEAASK